MALLGAFEYFATAGEIRAFSLADGDVVQVLLELRLVDDRADIRSRRQRVIDLERSQALAQRGDKTVVDVRADDQARRRGATLSRREERAVDRAVHGHGQVRVVEDDQRIFAAHFQLQLGHARDRLGRDRAAGRHRAGEADGIDAPVVDDRLADDAATTHDQVEDARGYARFDDDVRQRPGRPGYQLRRLEHHAVAVAECGRDLPRRNRHRKIPRGDDADDAQGFARHLDVNAGADRLNLLPRQPQRLAAEEFEDLSRAHDFADALGQRLAFFARKQPPELVLAGEYRVADGVEQIRAILHRGHRPCGKCGARGANRGVGLCAVGPRVFADDVA